MDPAQSPVLDGSNNGTGTLRQALVNANANAGPDFIAFKADVFDIVQVIPLEAYLPVLTGEVSITGTSAAFCTISGGGQFVVFRSMSDIALALDNLTIIDALGTNGSAVSMSLGSLTITNTVMSGCQAALNGGSIFMGNGDVIIADTEIKLSSAKSGGAIQIDQGTLYLDESKFKSTQAFAGNGGAVNITKGNLFISSNVLMESTGSFFSDGSFGGAICIAAGNAVINDFTADLCGAGGLKDTSGGGVISLTGGNLTVTDSMFTRNSVTNLDGNALGGAIYFNGLAGGTFSLELSVFNKCVANGPPTTVISQEGSGGAIHSKSGKLRIEGSVTISGCEAKEAGGAISIDTVAAESRINGVSISTCLVEGKGNLLGGGIAILNTDFVLEVPLIISNTTISNCTVNNTGSGSAAGGAIHLANGRLAIDNLTISGCFVVSPSASAYGGGVSIGFGHLTMTATTISGCSAKDFGGGISAKAIPPASGNGRSVTIQGGGIDNCQSNLGGGMAAHETSFLTIQDATLHQNTAGTGGSVYVDKGGSARMDRSTINKSTSANSGGGLYSNNTDWTITTSTLSNNTTANDGGGIYFTASSPNTPVLTVKRSTISGNDAGSGTVAGNGGGIFLLGSSILLANSTISNNIADNGGGIEATTLGASLQAPFSTIVLNQVRTAGQGGGVRVASIDSTVSAHTIDFLASVIAGNTAEEIRVPVLNDTTVTIDYSATTSSLNIAPTSGTYSYNPDGNGFQTSYADLKLTVLQNNGGPTSTHKPIAADNSPLIDVIPSSAGLSVALDQTGLIRAGSKFDIGSVEVTGGGSPVVSSFTVNGGDTQRSRITTITINFSSAVPADIFAEYGAITLTRTAATPAGIVGTVVQTQAGGSQGLIQVSPATGSSASFVLTFTNANGAGITTGVEHQSLADGRWQLAVPSAAYASTKGDVTLRRLYGDYDGDGTVGSSNGTVDGSDFAAFSAAFGTSNPTLLAAFDFNQAAGVDILDFAHFGNRFGLTL